MFLEEINMMKEVFIKYFGDGKYLIIFIIALVAIAAEERKKENRNLLVYYTAIMFAVIFNPIVIKILLKFITDSVYHRMFWMLPVGIVMAYFFTTLISKVDKKYMKLIISIAIICVIMYSGKIIYSKENFKKVNNWYKVSDEYVEIIGILSSIHAEHKKVLTIPDMNAYIRQIDASIKLAYPRRPTGDYDRVAILNQYYYGDIEVLTNSCKANKINIVVFDREFYNKRKLY